MKTSFGNKVLSALSDDNQCFQFLIMSSETALTLAQQQKIAELKEYQRFAAPFLPHIEIKRVRFEDKDSFVTLHVRFGEDTQLDIMRVELFGYASFFLTDNVQAPLALSDFRLTITKGRDTCALVVDLAGRDLFCVGAGPGYLDIRFLSKSASTSFDTFFSDAEFLFGESPYFHGNGVHIPFPSSIDLGFERKLREFLDTPLVQKYVTNENIVWK